MAVCPEQFRDCLPTGFALVLLVVAGTAVSQGQEQPCPAKSISAIEAKAAAQFRFRILVVDDQP